MASNDDLNKANQAAEEFNQTLKQTGETAGFTEDALRSIASTFQSAMEEAIDAATNLDSITLKVAKSYERDIVNGIKKLGPSLEKSVSIQQKLNQGLDVSKDLIAEKNRLEAQTVILNQRLDSLERQGVDVTEHKVVLNSQLAEINAEINGLLEQQNAQSAHNADIIEKTNRNMGLAGGLIGGINELAGKFAKSFNLQKVEADMEKLANEIAKGEKSAGLLGARFKVLGAGISSAFGNLGTFLTDPLVILHNLKKGFEEVDKVSTAYTRQTGNDINTLSNSLNQFGSDYVTLAEYIQTANDITTEFKVNAEGVFDQGQIMQAAELTKNVGLAGKETANLARLSKVNGGNIEAQAEAIVQGVNAANRQNKTAVAHGAILKDVANVSEGIAIKFAGYPDKLGEASAAAAGLGMSLGDVDKIAGSLLQFEQSINAELEAELLTGRQLNLEKARELALSNDLAGVAEELANQGITSANFSQMNRIQQEAQAKALGMSVDDMARMLLQQEMNNGLSEDALSDAQKKTLEDLKQVEAQEKFAAAIAKLQQALAPVVEFFADILSNSYVIYGVLGAAVGLKIWKNLGGMASSFKTAKDGATSLFSYFQKEGGGIKGLFGGIGDTIKDKWMGGMGKVKSKAGDWYDANSPQGKMIRTKGGTIPLDGDKTKEALGKGSDGVSKASDNAKGVKGDLGKEIEKFLKGVGRGLRFIGQNFADILKGGLALLVASPGLIALGLAAPGLFVLSMIPGPAINAALTGLGRGLSNFVKYFGIGDAVKFAIAGTLMAVPLIAIGLAYSAMGGDPMVLIGLGIGLMGLAGAMMVVGAAQGNIISGALALAVLGVALIPATLAFSMLGGVDTGTMLAFSLILPLLGLAAAGLGMIAPFILAGAGALAVLGFALIPAAIAFNLISEVDVDAIVSFAKGVGILATGAAAMGFAAPLILAGSVALTALGLALIPTTMAFSMLAEANFEGLVSSLTGLASIAPSLFLVAGGLGAISIGLASMAITGLLALPVIGALTALGAVSEGLGSIFGGESEGGDNEGSMKAIEEKLDTLISVVSAGGDVYIDGSKVGKTLQLASSRMG
jgi:hypothetical protein